jgi:hypothetical protein
MSGVKIEWARVWLFSVKMSLRPNETKLSYRWRRQALLSLILHKSSFIFSSIIIGRVITFQIRATETQIGICNLASLTGGKCNLRCSRAADEYASVSEETVFSGDATR